MVNQANKVSRKQSVDDANISLRIIILIICAVAAIHQLSANEDDFLSKEAANYMHRHGTGYIFNDQGDL
jgi:hypothetical protein